jgi:amino acid transporter/nucleotide-binding universal stress UspA family protein
MSEGGDKSQHYKKGWEILRSPHIHCPKSFFIAETVQSWHVASFMEKEDTSKRHLGLVGATFVGIGAIVGGGILALAGAAFAVTGPSAILAFGLNGVIAFLTALSFAEIASKFPQSGGTYTFAKKVLSVETAFMVGWVVWFASIVAAVLYAVGFAQFAVVFVDYLWADAPEWVLSSRFVAILAALATLFYMSTLIFKGAGGGNLSNYGKLVVFAILIVAGVGMAFKEPATAVKADMTPFLAAGAAGLFQAMGFTFIALQGFDLIAAVGGEVRDPERNIPKAMMISLTVALFVYIPLLLVITIVGTPAGESITAASKANPETIVALAAKNYLGNFGYVLVMIAAILSMLSALVANLYAASRVAMSMSLDHNLPSILAALTGKNKNPSYAVALTALVVIIVIFVVPNVAAAGAAASLIFLITFALAHWIAILVRQRSVQNPPPFRVPAFPLVPIVGGVACLVLAIFQGVTVPSAGIIAVVWLSVGMLLFLFIFAQRARVADATSSALDPELVRLRGRNPLVLVPIANPDSAAGLVAVAQTLAPPSIGRVLMLSVVVAKEKWKPEEDAGPLENTHRVLTESMTAAAGSGYFPQTLASVAENPWQEISRVAQTHRCDSLLMGFSRLSEDNLATPLDEVMSNIDCDIVLLRAPKNWRLENARRILIPTAGRGGHDHLLARLVGSLYRTIERELTFLKIIPEQSTGRDQEHAKKQVEKMVKGLHASHANIVVDLNASPVDAVVKQAEESDLIILGVQRVGKNRKLFGQFAMEVARRTDCPIIMISRRG